MTDISQAQWDQLLSAAVLAPSSHNTQPWRFECQANVLSCYADFSRALPVNDPDHRELHISCGCALMNLRIAAARAGLAYQYALLPDPAQPALLARFTITGPADNTNSESQLFTAIDQRQTYRHRFKRADIAPDALVAMQAAAAAETATLTCVPGQKMHDIAVLVAEGDSHQWQDDAWRQELADWMHARRKGDGLTVPRFVEPLARAAVRKLDMGAGIAARDRHLADESPLMLLLSSQADTPQDWLKTGMALERLLLVGVGYGLQASYLNQPIQVACLRPRLQACAGIESQPQILLRMGVPEEVLPAAPRRLLEEVIGENAI